MRGGGHNGAGPAACDDGLVIDLSADAVASRVDPACRRSASAAGCTSGDVDHATHALRSGRALRASSRPPVSPASRSAAARLSDSRSYGLTCDNLLEADVVLAAAS